MKHLPLLLTITLLAACHHQPASTADIQGRLAAAHAIGNNQDRDEALAQVAKDASDVKIVQVTQEALMGIGNNDIRNHAAKICAINLARQGENRAAQSIAGSIGDNAIRDQALKAIAMGQN